MIHLIKRLNPRPNNNNSNIAKINQSVNNNNVKVISKDRKKRPDHNMIIIIQHNDKFQAIFKKHV